ncbi:MAG: hypothetical protein QW279_06715, partial [Candidatus Jordarchaeaceae archaeon]
MTLEKKESKESVEKKKETKALGGITVKEAEPGAALVKPKATPEPMEILYVKGRLLGKVALVTGGSVGLGNGIS